MNDAELAKYEASKNTLKDLRRPKATREQALRELHALERLYGLPLTRYTGSNSGG
jgi:hypothetical protein